MLLHITNGHSLQWESMVKHKLKQFTCPSEHGGAYYDLDLIFRDTCDLVLPCAAQMRITMALQVTCDVW